MMRFRKQLVHAVVWLIVAIGAVLFAWMALIRWGSPRLLFPDEIRVVEEQAAKVESFAREHGAPPAPEELSMPSERMFYEREPDGGYKIGFSVGFDEIHYYDAKSGKWSFER